MARDSMTLEEVIRFTKQALENVNHGKRVHYEFRFTFEQIKQLLEWLWDYKELKAHFESLPDWIPVWVSCEEAMPKRDGFYLAYYTFADGRHACDMVYFNVGSPISNSITHWMPLPEPPKGV